MRIGRWLNLRRFLLVFTVLQVCVLLGGCTAAWLSAVNSLLPALQTAVSAVVAFIAALEGKTVSTAFVDAAKRVQADVAASITNAQTLIGDFQKTASTGLLSQIQAVFQGIVDNLNSILTGLSITDSATVNKLTALVGLAVAAAQSIVALIPVVYAKLESGASHAALEAEDKVASNAIGEAHKLLKSTYHAIVSEPTESEPVNAALSVLPQNLP